MGEGKLTDKLMNPSPLMGEGEGGGEKILLLPSFYPFPPGEGMNSLTTSGIIEPTLLPKLLQATLS
jgi:hypothetical protein